jgi:uncharacterized protein
MAETATHHDPRPRAELRDGAWTVPGFRCSACSFATVLETRRCPDCGGQVVPTSFGPGGVVWSHTVVRIPFNGRTPPYPIAYVDLDGGQARVLVHLPVDGTDVEVGRRVQLTQPTENADITAEVVA